MKSFFSVFLVCLLFLSLASCEFNAEISGEVNFSDNPSEDLTINPSSEPDASSEAVSDDISEEASEEPSSASEPESSAEVKVIPTFEEVAACATDEEAFELLKDINADEFLGNEEWEKYYDSDYDDGTIIYRDFDLNKIVCIQFGNLGELFSIHIDIDHVVCPEISDVAKMSESEALEAIGDFHILVLRENWEKYIVTDGEITIVFKDPASGKNITVKSTDDYIIVEVKIK